MLSGDEPRENYVGRGGTRGTSRVVVMHVKRYIQYTMTGRKTRTRETHHTIFDGFDCPRDERFRLRIARRTTTSTLIDR